MRIARLPLVIVALVGLAGCGSSEGGSGYGSHPATAPAGGSAKSCETATAGTAQLRVTGVDCDVGRDVIAGWANGPACSAPASVSRTACEVEGYRCLGTATDAGLAVSCAAPDRSISFLARRG